MMIDTNVYVVLAVLVMSFTFNDCTGSGSIQKEKSSLEPFAVSYEYIRNLKDAAEQYNLLIIEPENYSRSEIQLANDQSTKIIAYVTLGEVDRNRWYYPLLEERGFLGVNENWDSPYLNLADSTTRSIMLDQVVPNIMSKGFDGLFLDTVDDVAPYTERAHLQPHMLDIITKIRKSYPDALIIQNAGFFLLDKTHDLINGVLIEDVATSYNFDRKSYNLKSTDAYKEKAGSILKLKKKYKLPFLVVDFSDNKHLTNLTIKRLDSLSLPYFISSIELNDISKGISSNSSKKP